ncbi:MAG: alpha/beta hydrolase, partial [Pseudomonadota bacterium]|nr:alpha/beta hydrolase [Pseudomonadota bacterium]
MTSADLASFPHPPPDERIPYGDDPLQFGDLRVPDNGGPHPVAIFIHGGQWKADFDIAHSDKLTDALTRNGIA